jgi:hypothetical protein
MSRTLYHVVTANFSTVEKPTLKRESRPPPVCWLRPGRDLLHLDLGSLFAIRYHGHRRHGPRRHLRAR